MISFYQSLFNFKYSYRPVNRLSGFANMLFLISFTDALRYLMRLFEIHKNDQILVPRFYCPETLAVLKKFGTLCFYEIDTNLQPIKESYFNAVKKYRPKVIINYSFTGFSLNLSEQKLLAGLVQNSNTLIIEDCAHKIIKKEQIIFSYPYHCYIDSKRKYTSLLGSHLIANFPLIHVRVVSSLNTYVVKLVFLNLLKHVCDAIYLSTRLNFLEGFCDKLFDAIDSLVGSYSTPSYAPSFYSTIWEHIDLKAYEQKIQVLTKRYQEIFSRFNQYVEVPSSVLKSDQALPYFPVIIKKEVRAELLSMVENLEISATQLWESEHMAELDQVHELYESVVIFPLTVALELSALVKLEEALQNFHPNHRE